MRESHLKPSHTIAETVKVYKSAYSSLSISTLPQLTLKIATQSIDNHLTIISTQQRYPHTMGFGGLVPASELSAVYDPVKQVLTLAASGEVQNYTYGYKFQRMSWIGGLRFELIGWTGPIGQGTSKYSFSQDFPIPGLTVFDPEGTVIIVTSNHRNGEAIKIKFLGLQPPAVSNGSEMLSTIQGKLSGSENPAPPQVIDVATPLTINTLFREPFNISEKIPTGTGATLHVNFDTQFLTLTEAGVDDGGLNWTFNSVQTGDTQVITYSTAGFFDPIIRKVYSVKIFVLDAVTATSSSSKGALLVSSNGNGNSNSASNGTTNGNGVAKPTEAILSFLGRVFEAQVIAQRVLPSARLLRVVATNPLQPVYPHISPLVLPSQLEVLFVGDDGKYVTINSIGWGEWAAPAVKDGPVVLGLQAFDLDTVKVDLDQAIQAVRAGGNDKDVYEFTLADPFGNPNNGPYQPMYSLRMGDFSIVSVNAVTGKVIDN